MPWSTSRWSISGLSPVTRTNASSPKRSTTSRSGRDVLQRAAMDAPRRAARTARRPGRRSGRSTWRPRRASARSQCSRRSTRNCSVACAVERAQHLARQTRGASSAPGRPRRSSVEVVQPAQPQLEVHELPEEHHVVLARLARARRSRRARRSAGAPRRRRRCRARGSPRSRPGRAAARARAREPDVGRRVPARLLDPRARLLGQDAPSSPRAAGASSRRRGSSASPGTRNISSTSRWSKNGSQLRSPKAARLAVLGAQAAGRRLAEEVLVGAVLEVARERRGPSPARSAPKSKNAGLERGAVALDAGAVGRGCGPAARGRRAVPKPCLHRLPALAEDRVVVVARPTRRPRGASASSSPAARRSAKRKRKYSYSPAFSSSPPRPPNSVPKPPRGDLAAEHVVREPGGGGHRLVVRLDHPRRRAPARPGASTAHLVPLARPRASSIERISSDSSYSLPE